MNRSVLDPFKSDVELLITPGWVQLEPQSTAESPEGLLSWVIGLSMVHCLGPRTLIKHLVSSSVKYESQWCDAAFFDRYSGTVNGIAHYAQMILNLLQKEDMRDFLHMTLVGLRHLLPPNGEGFLVKSPRWCSHCLCDQARRGDRPHYPLIWSFEHYRFCEIHQIHLSQQCSACGAIQPFVPIYPSLLHCNTCGEPLLRPTSEPQPQLDSHVLSPTDFDRWCSRALIHLVNSIPTLERDGSLAHFRNNLLTLVLHHADGNRAKFCESIRLQPRAINGWLGKNERPSLGLLLRIGYAVSIFPAQLFLPELIQGANSSKLKITSTSTRASKPILGELTRERISRQLQLILRSPDDFPKLNQVAASVGLTRHALKYWFPLEAVEIVRKARAQSDRNLVIRYKRDHDTLKEIIISLQAKQIYPGRRLVEAELRKRRLSLMRPDLMQLFQQLSIHG